jgi:hypothetical protein
MWLMSLMWFYWHWTWTKIQIGIWISMLQNMSLLRCQIFGSLPHKKWSILDQVSWWIDPHCQRKGNITFPHSQSFQHVNDVLHVPKVSKNLLLVGAITDKKCCNVVFGKAYCWVKNSNTKQVMVIRKRNNTCGLYKLEITKPAPTQSTTHMFQEHGSDVTNHALA